jgi:hypothetical protein
VYKKPYQWIFPLQTYYQAAAVAHQDNDRQLANRQGQSYQHHAGQHHEKKLNNRMAREPKSSVSINRTKCQSLYGANHRMHRLYQQLHLQKLEQRHLQEKEELTQYPQQKILGHHSEAALEHNQHPLQVSEYNITMEVYTINSKDKSETKNMPT